MNPHIDYLTKRARDEAHKVFDRLWKRKPHGIGGWTRSQAYKWLAWYTGLPLELAHFSMFDIDRCNRVRDRVLELLADPSPNALIIEMARVQRGVACG